MNKNWLTYDVKINTLHLPPKKPTPKQHIWACYLKNIKKISTSSCMCLYVFPDFTLKQRVSFCASWLFLKQLIWLNCHDYHICLEKFTWKHFTSLMFVLLTEAFRITLYNCVKEITSSALHQILKCVLLIKCVCAQLITYSLKTSLRSYYLRNRF